MCGPSRKEIPTTVKRPGLRSLLSYYCSRVLSGLSRMGEGGGGGASLNENEAERAGRACNAFYAR